MSVDGHGLRVLMAIHTPWTRDLGAPQAQIELAEHLELLGVKITKFSVEDAFGVRANARGRLARSLDSLQTHYRRFSPHARRYVRAHGTSFNVVDAHQTDLPYSKTDLKFTGTLVARSVGLIPAYARFEAMAARRWRTRVALRHRLFETLVAPARLRRIRDTRASFVSADAIVVPNEAEFQEVSQDMGFGSKVVKIPLGISLRRLRELGAAASHPESRLARKTIAFIGNWTARKGAFDWPEIVTSVLEREPRAQFLFLGTGLASESVRSQFAPQVRHAVSVTPAYQQSELPDLLANATVGAFPSYLEGFGLSVLEKLAARLPTVAYDAPGPADILAGQLGGLLVPIGDTAAFADTVLTLLRLPMSDYITAAEAAAARAAHFTWNRIAVDTLHVYEKALGRT